MKKEKERKKSKKARICTFSGILQIAKTTNTIDPYSICRSQTSSIIVNIINVGDKKNKKLLFLSIIENTQEASQCLICIHSAGNQIS